MLKLKVVRTGSHAAHIPPPSYATPGSVGLDLSAAAFWTRDNEAQHFDLEPGGMCLVLTGFAVEIPEGYEGQIRPRSGNALRRRLTVINSPGTIDQDYRGEVGVMLINLGREVQRLNRGMKIAQLVIAPVARVAIVEADELSTTERAAGGFGSTGE